ncbi:MAG: sigma-70 family RNA polymerase sigma factor [Solirubrobacterales bacterium]|nr:sigma-70 family RNA polymerase sigma factor [Solirubrobacterales bacterium]
MDGNASPSPLRSQGGDLGDIGELYASLSAHLERIVGMDVRAPRPLIEDACQFAWVRLWHHRDRVRRDSALSWLATTAIREAFKLLRGQARCLSLEETIERAGEGAFATHACALEEVFEHRIRLDLLGSLSERQQRMVWLHGLGFSYEEIAATTGCTTRTVERQLLRGKRTLRATAVE